MSLFLTQSFSTPNFYQDRLLRLMLPEEYVAISQVLRRTVGWQKPSDTIAISQISDNTGLSASTVREALRSLERYGILRIDECPGKSSLYTPALHEEGIDFEGLEARLAERKALHSQRTANATASRMEKKEPLTSNEPLTCDVTPNVGRIPTPNVGRCETPNVGRKAQKTSINTPKYKERELHHVTELYREETSRTLEPEPQTLSEKREDPEPNPYLPLIAALCGYGEDARIRPAKMAAMREVAEFHRKAGTDLRELREFGSWWRDVRWKGGDTTDPHASQLDPEDRFWKEYQAYLAPRKKADERARKSIEATKRAREKEAEQKAAPRDNSVEEWNRKIREAKEAKEAEERRKNAESQRISLKHVGMGEEELSRLNLPLPPDDYANLYRPLARAVAARFETEGVSAFAAVAN